MNEKLKSLIKVTGISPDTVRYNKKAITNLISGESPGPGPQPPTPSENTIVFSGSSLVIAFDANGETVTVTITSTINGFYIPFTIEAPNWITPTNNNGTLSLVASKNATGEDRSGSIILTQGELDGEQKTITIEVSQEAAVVPTFDFISNPNIMQFGNGDNIILDYIFNEATGAEKKAISGGQNPTQVLDPKCMKNYDVFGLHHSQFKDNANLTDASLLGYMPIVQIPGGAFSGCGKLHRVLIPETCTFIGDNAFRYCGSYEPEYHVYTTLNIYFLGSTPPTFGSLALSDITFGKIYVPVGAKAAYDAALPNYTQYIEEADIKASGPWNGNVSYKYDATAGYYVYVDPNIGFDETMSYINA